MKASQKLMLGILGLLGCCFLIWTACAWVLEAPYPWEWLFLYQAKAGLGRDLQELPQPKEFQRVTLITPPYVPDRSERNGCYPAAAFIAFGTTLSPQTAIERYIQSLSIQGWQLRESGAGEWILIRRPQEKIIIWIGEPGLDFAFDSAYRQAQEKFPTFVYLHLYYILPQVNGCY
ncbi:hypothetical protein [Thermogutta sp.]|jgi:hypothetical protein|uniref:hypothetical protein n=1 Tax=Thermogutta sp. TaxID=1962930 RepID=UPI00322020EC